MTRLLGTLAACLVLTKSLPAEAPSPGRFSAPRTARMLNDKTPASTSGAPATHPNDHPQVKEPFREGKKSGVWTWWYPNGQRQAEGRFLDDLRTGPWAFWHENGQRKMEGEYRGGVQFGKWISWDEDGRVEHVEEFTREKPAVRSAPVPLNSGGNVADDQPVKPAMNVAQLPPDTLQEVENGAAPAADHLGTAVPAANDLRTILRKWRAARLKEAD